jgi:hypothetical protein
MEVRFIHCKSNILNLHFIPSPENSRFMPIVPLVPEYPQPFQWHYILKILLYLINFKMRVAHLILTYTDPELTERLIRKTQHRNADFYIHVDRKVDINRYLHLRGFNQVYFIKNRKDLRWAGFSTVLATFGCIKEIVSSGIRYGFINLLSGQDYPLKTASELDSFFQKNMGREYLSYCDFKNDWKEGLLRIENYFLNDYDLPGKYVIEKVLRNILPKRKLPYGLQPYGKSMFWILSPEAAMFVVNKIEGDKKLKRFLSLCWGTDEFVFQTILMNSPFRQKVINNNYRYIDWSAGGANPKTLDLSDASALLNSDMLYARKFDLALCHEIIDFIDTQILSHGTTHQHSNI